MPANLTDWSNIYKVLAIKLLPVNPADLSIRQPLKYPGFVFVYMQLRVFQGKNGEKANH